MIISVISDKPDLRENFCKVLGKETSKEDISFYSSESNGKIKTIVEPTQFPDKIQPLLHAITIADFVVLVVDKLTPFIGEAIVALDLLKKDKGILVSSLSLPIGGTVIEKYEKINDINIAKDKVLALEGEKDGDELFALIDKSFSTDAGNVALGVIKSGKIKKQESFFLLPDKRELAVRNVHLNDKDVDEVGKGDRFGISYKGDVIQNKGLLVPLRNNFEVATSINGRFLKSPFFRDDLDHKIHAYHNYQFVEAMVSLSELRLDKPIAYQKGDRVLVVDSSNQKIRIAGAFTSAW